jgi:tetratricopeptide (TPR) repeat protein
MAELSDSSKETKPSSWLAETAGEGLNLLSETAKGAVHSLAINPYNSVIQIANSASEAVAGHGLGWKTTDALAADPKATGAQATARAIGESAGNILQFMGMARALKALPLAQTVSNVGSAEAMTLSTNSMMVNGTAGFLQGSLVMPLKDGESQWNRLAHGGASSISMMTMEAAPVLFRNGLASGGFRGTAAAVESNLGRLMIGGGAGAVAQVQADSFFTTGKAASLGDSLDAATGGIIAGGIFHLGGKAFTGARSYYGGAAEQASLQPSFKSPSDNIERISPVSLTESQASWKQLELPLEDTSKVLNSSETPASVVERAPKSEIKDRWAERDEQKAQRLADSNTVLANKNEAMTYALNARNQRLHGNTKQADSLADKALKLVGLDSASPADGFFKLMRPQEWWDSDPLHGKASEAALGVFKKAYGLDHPLVSQTLESVVSAPTTITSRTPTLDLSQTRPFIGALIESRKAQFGPEHPAIADALQKIGHYDKYHGHYDRALPAIARAAEIRANAFGLDNMSVAETLEMHGATAMSRHRLSTAIESYERALQIMDKSPEATPRDKVNVLNGLAESLIENGARDKAEKLLERAIKIENEQFTGFREASMREKTGSLLARIYMQSGHIDQAIDLYRTAGRSYAKLPDTLSGSTATPPAISDAITPTSNPYLQVFDRVSASGLAENRDLRWGVVNKYSWWVPDENALSTVMKQGKLISVGSGTGYAEALLRARGADVLAFDAFPAESGTSYYHSAGKSWTNIAQGTESVVSQHPDRTLMLAWPPAKDPFTKRPHAMAYNALKNYSGNRLVYIGDEECTGDKRFHDLLARDWSLVESQDIPQWHNIRDSLNIYQRRQGVLPFL